VSLTGALFTLPAGILTDRSNRTRLLAVSIVAWAAAVVMSGFAPTYRWMRLARVALGVVTATAGPAVVVSGDLSSLTTWRAAYWWLAVPTLILAWVIWRLPEPARGGASRIPAGAAKVHRAAFHPGGGGPAAFRLRVAVRFGGPGSASSGSDSTSASGSAGLEYTFLIFLCTLLAAGLLALIGLRTYPRDVATAAASAAAIDRAADDGNTE
jgi:hypothetical protein